MSEAAGRFTADSIETSVLIAGAGPVGMTLAMDLAIRGIDVVVAERRDANEPPSPKCNHVSARSMEIFRRLGVAAKVRQAGLPGDYPHDIAISTSVIGKEISRIRIPCRDERYTGEGADSGWPTPEPPHRINQIYLEPILLEHLKSMHNVRFFNQVSLDDFEQDEEGVTAIAKDLAAGGTFRIRAHYLVGCEGSRSLTRRKIGSTLQGDPIISRAQATFIRAPGLMSRIAAVGEQPAWMWWLFGAEFFGGVVALDGCELFIAHCMHAGEEDLKDHERDAGVRRLLGVGEDFEYETLNEEDWTGRRLVADRYRDRRVFICGDSAHNWIPFAGYGMNAGIADAAHLSATLAAVLKGWGAPELLDMYEQERRPVTVQASYFIMEVAKSCFHGMNAVLTEDLAETGPVGEAARAKAAPVLHATNVEQFACAGLNFSYSYESSPIIVHDGAEAPAYTLGEYTPSTVPGCRTPHFWLADGSSLYDHLGLGYTLLRFDSSVSVDVVVEAAVRRGMPLSVLDVDLPTNMRDVYRHKLLLSRPDQHVAWRGDCIPDNPLSLVDVLRGAKIPAPVT